MKLTDMPNVPVLEGGWISLTEAAERLGYTRSYLYRLAGQGKFDSLRKLGASSTFIINESEIKKLNDSKKSLGVSEAATAENVQEELAEQQWKNPVVEAINEMRQHIADGKEMPSIVVEYDEPESPITDAQPEPSPIVEEEDLKKKKPVVEDEVELSYEEILAKL